MAAIERELVNSRCGDGRDLDRPDENAIEKFKGGDVSSEPKSPPPPTKPRALFFSEWLLLNSDIDSSDTASDSDSDGEREDLALSPFFLLSSIFNMRFKFLGFLSKFQ
jgi:hypothetical protein